MAPPVDTVVPTTVPPALTCLLLFLSLAHTQSNLVFQPSVITTTGPVVSAFLLGNSSGASLNLRTVSPSNTSGSVGAPSCDPEDTQWVVTREQLGKTAALVQLRLNQSLHLCGENDTETECCPKPLCVLDTLQLSACVDGRPTASLLLQATIHAQLVPTTAGSDNQTVIPNQVYQPLGPCPCDLTSRACDVRCCCDKDCSDEDLKLFVSHCLPGPFGGQVSPPADYQCSVQSAENSPDWFPFLCVNSPPENNPYLGHFYHGDTIAPPPGPSFQSPASPAPVPVNVYVQGSPIITFNEQYFTIPQKALGQCVDGAPVAFLQNFECDCVSVLHSCPPGSPLETGLKDLSVALKDGLGGDVTVDVTDEVATTLSSFIPESDTALFSNESVVCENVTLALDYRFYWKENSITGVSVTRTVGDVTFRGSVTLTTRYSAVFLNGDFMAEPNSGAPGYQVGRPVIGGVIDALENNTGSVQRTSINLWNPVSDGFCSSAGKKPVRFGLNSTSGCLLPVSRQNLSQCDVLRETVAALQTALITATYVAKIGNPDSFNMADWVNISFGELNSSTAEEDFPSPRCSVPSHQHIQVWSLITSVVQGEPQRQISAVQVSYHGTTWAQDCGGGAPASCEDPEATQLFPITSSVTFIDIPIDLGPTKTRFQINYTEYDCNRNDVCWPELAFPFTRFYTGEPYSLALAKGMILVSFFIAASILGTPWRQIRQAWSSAVF